MAATDLVYADSSALVKLAVDEQETEALRAYVDRATFELISSVLAIVEVQRGIRLADLRTPVRTAHDVLDRVLLIDLDRGLLHDAVSFTSSRVRSLDAIHLVSARRSGARQMLVYDRRLAEAASAAGLEVLQPGV
ncbi:MAG: type II toxin-antitoxin system VapC family toxin [Actinobacteria bacterium]|nr:type II toxin-antitoxin system VapC family toxin [Actinomycetota bacterium]